MKRTLESDLQMEQLQDQILILQQQINIKKMEDEIKQLKSKQLEMQKQLETLSKLNELKKQKSSNLPEFNQNFYYEGSNNRRNIPIIIKNSENLIEIDFIKNILENIFNIENIEIQDKEYNSFNLIVKIRKESDIPDIFIEEKYTFENQINTSKFQNIDNSEYDLISISVYLYNYLSKKESQNFSGLFGTSGLFPPITINKNSGINNFEFLVSFLKESGSDKNFKKFHDIFTLYLQNGANTYNNVTKHCNMNGYLELGSELYPGSLIISARNLVSYFLQTDTYCGFFGNDRIYIIKSRECDLDAYRQLAILCSQCTTPVGANCSIFASKKFDNLLQSQKLGDIKDNDIFPEGLQYLFNFLNNNISDIDKQVSEEFAITVYNAKQWYSFWILYRLLLEAKRRKIGENIVKYSEHETDDDFEKYNERIIYLFEKTLDKINSILTENTESEENLNKYENRWHIYNLCKKMIDIYNFIK